MTNRAQAKPTKDPKDPIQHQSLLTITFLMAGLVFASVVYMVADDWWMTKPWKPTQDKYVDIATAFLAEELANTSDAIMGDNQIKATRDALNEQKNQASAELQSAAAETFDKISAEIAKLTKDIETIEGTPSDKFWLKEMASRLGEAKFRKEMHRSSYTDEEYRAILDEVNARRDMISQMRLRLTQLNNRAPEINATLSSIDASLKSLTSPVDTLKQTISALTAYERRFYQVFKPNQGKTDIVDRCESCHVGTDKTYLQRDKMWGSHLSNDKVRDFVREYSEKEWNFWQYSGERIRTIRNLAWANGDLDGQDSFFSADPVADGNTIDTADVSYLRIKNFAEVAGLFEMTDAVQSEALEAWNRSQNWRNSPALQETTTVSTDGDGTDDAESEEAPEAVPTAVTMFLEKKGLNYAERAAALPSHFLVAEAWVWLASNGPYPIEGGLAYPDRFGFGNKPWFQKVVKDPRVVEFYRQTYRRFAKHIREELLMFTGHSRHEEILGNVHDKSHFGCMSCHRGFGINTKSVESAHGYQHHWLVPLFKDGYQEAGCQKCHKAEIEVAGARRLQRGKDLYQDLGCWGCHAYEGYESEAQGKFAVAKNLKDMQAEYDRVKAMRQSAQGEYEHNFGDSGDGYSRTFHRIRASGFQGDDLALLSKEGELAKKAAEGIQSLIHQENLLAEQVNGIVIRSDEIDREHKRKGPNLKDIALKVPEDMKGWLANWIRYPKNFRPSTRMPHFFYGPTAFVDEVKILEAGGSEADMLAAFESEGIDGDKANPMYRRLNKQNVDNLKSIIRHVWQASKVSVDLGDVRGISDHKVPVENKDAVDSGRVLFASKGCLSCHSVLPDLVQIDVPIPFIDVKSADGENEPFTEYRNTQLWGPAPKYQYRTDGTIAYDANGNPRTNEFIYNKAANLSRIGEKASADYLVEWVAQPRLRNKHSIMPSFFAAIAGTPDGMEREALDAEIAKLSAMSGDPMGKLRLADAKRRRGDISSADIESYREAIRTAAGANLTDPNAAVILRTLGEALREYEQVLRVAAYLKSLKHPDASVVLDSPEKLKATDAGYVGDYEYKDLFWVPGEGEAATEDNAALGMNDAPAGEYQEGVRKVEGFGDFEFMEDGYEDYLKSRASLRTSDDLLAQTQRALTAMAKTLVNNSDEKSVMASSAIQVLYAMTNAMEGNLLLFSDASFADVTPAMLDDLSARRAEFSNALSTMLDRVAAIREISTATPRNEIVDDMAVLTSVADALNQWSQVIRAYEPFTPAGAGKAYTSFYGCAGCHEIEGMENEGKIGVNLTEEGSKFIQRLDYGLLEHHATKDDSHTPVSPMWLMRGSVRTYDPDNMQVGQVRAWSPENAPVVRGGKGFELPEGIRQRYIHSKFHYHTRPAWFQGKVHHPRQWDKGRLLDTDDEKTWFERTRMPLFELNEEELYAITIFIEGSENLQPWGAGSGELPAAEYKFNHLNDMDAKVDGWWIIKKYNCTGCHSVGDYEGRFRRLGNAAYGAFVKNHLNPDGASVEPIKLSDDIVAPPVLWDAGSRVDSGWLVNWLREPYWVRSPDQNANIKMLIGSIDHLGTMGGNNEVNNAALPAQSYTANGKEMQYFTGLIVDAKVRMPQFYLTDHEAKAIQRFLTYTSNAESVSVEARTAPTPEAIAFGEKIFMASKCLSCHGIADFKAGFYLPGGKAPNLRQAKERVNTDWLRNWFKDPQSIQPGTEMYKYFRFDVPTGRWVLRDEAIGNDGVTSQGDLRPKNPDKSLIQYDGDHIDALIAFLLHGLETKDEAEWTEALKVWEDERK